MLQPVPQTNPEDVLSELIQFGVIHSVDYANAAAIVTIGDVQTPQIPWLERAGWIKSFVPPHAGEQVLVLVPNGDMMGAVIIGGLFSNINPAPAQNQTLTIKSDDGLNIQYDPQTGALAINSPGPIQITAPTISCWRFEC
ncbi:MAG: Baseplate assembly protein V [Hyphomonadaceae bacterium]|nr:MAG: Baseplate assembly protein V [Hyphomonadaceae bacterium]